MPQPGITLIGSGNAGNSVAVDTLVALVNAPGPGRFRVRIIGRHTLADGLKMTSPIALTLPSAPNGYVDTGDFVLDIPNNTAGINVVLAVATGASDTARAVIFAENLTRT